MSPWLRVVAAFALLAVAYVGLYWVLARPADSVILDGGSGYRVRIPGYRIGGRATGAIFRPALWADQRIPPRYWEFETSPYGSNCMSVGGPPE